MISSAMEGGWDAVLDVLYYKQQSGWFESNVWASTLLDMPEESGLGYVAFLCALL